MARPIRFLPPGVLYRCVRDAAHPIPDDPRLIRRLRQRLVARRDHIALIRVEAKRVETWFWADSDVSEISSLLNVVHSKLSRDINVARGTPGSVNFPGTSEPQPVLDDEHAYVLLAGAVLVRIRDSPTRAVLIGPDLDVFERGRLDARSRRSLERFVDMLAGFMGLGARARLLGQLVAPSEEALVCEATSHDGMHWTEELHELDDGMPCELLRLFLQAQAEVRDLYGRTGRRLSLEYGTGLCARGTHLHRPLRAAAVTVEEPVVSRTPGNPEPPAFCMCCEGRAGAKIDWASGGDAAIEAFIASQLRPSNGQLAGGGARLLDGVVAVRERPDPGPLANFEAAQVERRAWRREEAEEVACIVWDELRDEWTVVPRPRRWGHGWPRWLGERPAWLERPSWLGGQSSFERRLE